MSCANHDGRIRAPWAAALMALTAAGGYWRCVVDFKSSTILEEAQNGQ